MLPGISSKGESRLPPLDGMAIDLALNASPQHLMIGVEHLASMVVDEHFVLLIASITI